MNIQEKNNSQRKINLGKDNNNHIMDLAFKIIEEEANKMTTEKIYHSKEKEKIKNSLLKKSKIKKEKKTIKVRNLIDDEFIHEYNPEMQNNIINPKLNFFIDCESVSESDKDLSSASLSIDEDGQKDSNKKST